MYSCMPMPLPKRLSTRVEPYQTTRTKRSQSQTPGTYKDKPVDPDFPFTYETLKTWIITPELRVCFVVRNDMDIKIHLRRFDDHHYTPQGVTMTLRTWSNFAQKFALLDVLNADSGFVCNNEVLALVNSTEQVALQNLFSCRWGNFGLKIMALVLSKWEIESIIAELDMLIKEISEIEETFCNVN